MTVVGRDATGSQVPEGFVSALGKAFRDERSPSRVPDVVDYVTTGQPTSVIAAVRAHEIAWWEPAASQEALALLDDVPIEVLVRFGYLRAQADAGLFHRSDNLEGAPWVEALVRQAGPGRSVAIEKLEQSLVLVGLSAELAVTAAFTDLPTEKWRAGGYDESIRLMKGYAESVERHAEAIRATIGEAKLSGRLASIENLAAVPDRVLSLFVAEVADFACSGSAQVRQASSRLVDRLGSELVEPLRAIAGEAGPAIRVHAFQRLHELGDAELRGWVIDVAAKDRAASVRALVAALDKFAEDSIPEELPSAERPEIEWRVDVTPQVRSALDAIHQHANRLVDSHNRRYRDLVNRYAARGEQVPPWESRPQHISASWAAEIATELQAGGPARVVDRPQPLWVPWATINDHVAELAGIGTGGLLALLAASGRLTWDKERDELASPGVETVNRFHEVNGYPSLLEFSTALDEMGLAGSKLVLAAYADTWSERLGRTWPDEQVGPFVAAHLDEVLALLDNSHYGVDRFSVYRALGALPVLPRRVVEQMFTRALGSRKADRLPAQDLLAKRLPGFEARVIAALKDGRGETRVVAASWLARLGHQPAVPSLEAATGKEKQDLVRGAMLDALEVLGQPVERYVDREGLASTARKVVAKGRPKELDWFPVDQFPEVRWADTDESLTAEVKQWLLIQAVKAKTPEPGVMLRRYASLMDPRDREHLGQFVLDAWLAQDLIPNTPDQALEKAEAQRSWHPSGMIDDEWVASYARQLLREPSGSAISSKGVLAVAAACAGEGAVPVAERYLKQWYGYRAAQGRALIAMLAWVDDPSAIQLVLSVGQRFRTKSFQEEARLQAEALAERKGWTVAELADRTIPTGGFDAYGVRELSYGDRVFEARLRPDLTVELRSPEGKSLKSLPAPRQSDDEKQAAAAKKAFTAAKRELKSIVTLQSQRLYEAVCVERTWVYDDWNRYLKGHPVLRYLVQRLAWTATTPDGPVVFRPLDDGTLTDLDDNEVTVPLDASVAVAHGSNIDDETAAAWREHFADYEIAPLFDQFAAGVYEFSADRGNDRELTDYEGHLVDSFALRGRADKLGYTRGATEDGGWFSVYEKRFPTPAMTTVVGFTGNSLPEEARTVALRSLSFAKVGADGRHTRMRLADVPRVLLSEAFNDLRQMAAAGPGFDADWEMKVTG